MQININNNINAQNIAGSLQASKTNKPKGSRVDNTSVAVKVKYSKIIEMAQKGEAVDPQLVEDAKKLLASGQLDTPEGARQAATKLLQYGI